ncbi:hypothetical protein [Yinghuangia sp. YIM S10712]|uniref:hypothetical protein n=1 Tax=Yinghuangia sp. YIM S10712 TaxID=3436930 RepID=UPI003F53BA4B
MPRGSTFADAAGSRTPPKGTDLRASGPGTPTQGANGPYGSGPGSATVAGMPTAPGAAWNAIPSAPPTGPGRIAPPYDQPPGGGSPPHVSGDSGGDNRVRTLAVIAVIVALIAAAVTVVVWQPWSDDDTASVADASGGPTGQTGSATGTGPTPTPTPSGGNGTPSLSTSPSASPSPSPSASPSADPGEQARALSNLLDHSGSSRQSVIAAVNNAQACTALDSAYADLNNAAVTRRSLVEQLNTLKFDALPEVQPALEQLRTAWLESASADDHYAAWAEAQSTDGCGAGEADKAAGDAASGRATAAKQAFVRAWNDIATRYGLPTRTELAI